SHERVSHDGKLPVIEQGPNRLNCETEEAQRSATALLEALTAGAEGGALRPSPFGAHHGAHLIPEPVLAAVEQPVMDSEERCQPNSEQEALNCRRQRSSSLKGRSELLHLLGVADDPLSNPPVGAIAERLPAPIERLLLQACGEA